MVWVGRPPSWRRSYRRVWRRAPTSSVKHGSRGKQLLESWWYPKTLTFEITITNAAGSESPEIQAENALLGERGLLAPQALVVGAGGVTVLTQELTISDEAACLELAALDGLADRYIDTMTLLSWTRGGAQCSARIACPVKPPHPSWRCGEKGQGAIHSGGRCLEGGNGSVNGRGGPGWKGGGKGKGAVNGRGGTAWKGGQST